MAKGRTRTVIGHVTQMTTVRSQTVQGQRVRQVPVRRTPQSSPKHKKAKATGVPSSQSNIASLLPDDPLQHEHLSFITDMDPPSTKVTCLISYYFL